jgi:hypothetical protein
MGAQALPLGLLTVLKIPPLNACGVFAFVGFVSALSFLFPMVAGQAFEGLLFNWMSIEQNHLLWLLKPFQLSWLHEVSSELFLEISQPRNSKEGLL